MSDAPSFGKMVPGFEFLQSLVSNASAALPNIGQWVAPTLNPEELEKRIGELRTVQFWLEQNVRMLGATIQALEVQKMTLSTLKSMNVRMADLGESLKIKLPDPVPAPQPEPQPAPPPAAEAEDAADGDADDAAGVSATSSPLFGAAGLPKLEVPAGVADPIQWWGALTKQFTELATTAMKDAAAGEFAASAASKPARPTGDAAKPARSPVAAKKRAAKPAARKPGAA